MVGVARKLVLEEVLTQKEIQHILKQSIGEDLMWEFKGGEVKPAVDGIAGFLGDHMKIVLHVDVGGELRQVYLFLKRIPRENAPKAEYIDRDNFFRRERYMYQVLDEIDTNAWGVKAYIYTDSKVVLPDLTIQGYKPLHCLHSFDLQHMLVATDSAARFHAAFVNYETKKTIELNRPYSSFEEAGNLLTESTLCDSPWLRAGSKLSTNFLRRFSTKFYRNIPDLESKLTELYLEACDSFVQDQNTVNILIHRDLWANNILFKHENNIPTNAVIIDYQCIRYGPPAFDVMSLLYLTTDRKFRKEHEKNICDYYYAVFTKNLNNDSKKRLKALKYDKDIFFIWSEKARMFSIFLTIAIYPWVLMDSKSAQTAFDDPNTFAKYAFDDRTEPVVAYALKCEPYKQRNLEVIEEFVERYLLKQF